MGYSKGETILSNPINFIRAFLHYVDTVGIFDEYDKTHGKMITSAGVLKLISDAHSHMPEKLKPMAAMSRMRDLTDVERDLAIADAEKGRVIDMRKEFQSRMSKNNGAQGILVRLVTDIENGNMSNMDEVILDAKRLIEGPENVVELKNND